MSESEAITKSSTRERILAASMRLFALNGYNATSVRQIAQEVGLRESSLYNHFHSKDEILQTLLYSHGFGFVKEILEKDYLNREIDDPYQLLLSLANQILNRWEDEEDRMFWRLLLMEMFREPTARKVFIRDLNATRDFCVQLFKKMQDMDLIKPIDPWHLANEFFMSGVAIHIEYLILINEGLDVTPIYHDWRRQHVDYIWSVIKKD